MTTDDLEVTIAKALAACDWPTLEALCRSPTSISPRRHAMLVQQVATARAKEVTHADE